MPYERGSVPLDVRGGAGMGEEWYRDGRGKDRGGYDDYRRYG